MADNSKLTQITGFDMALWSPDQKLEPPPPGQARLIIHSDGFGVVVMINDRETMDEIIKMFVQHRDETWPVRPDEALNQQTSQLKRWHDMQDKMWHAIHSHSNESRNDGKQIEFHLANGDIIITDAQMNEYIIFNGERVEKPT